MRSAIRASPACASSHKILPKTQEQQLPIEIFSFLHHHLQCESITGARHSTARNPIFPLNINFFHFAFNINYLLPEQLTIYIANVFLQKAIL